MKQSANNFLAVTSFRTAAACLPIRQKFLFLQSFKICFACHCSLFYCSANVLFSQQYISMEIQSSTEDNKRSCQQQLTLHLAARSFPSQQFQASERACITFTQISKHIQDQLIKMLEFFPLVSCPTILTCGRQKVIQHILQYSIFSATATTSEALHFRIQELAIVECSGHMQIKIMPCFFVQRKFCVTFSCENKILRVFFVVQCV